MQDKNTSEDMFNTAMEAAGFAWWRMVLPSGEVYFAENKTKMLGYDKKDFKHYNDFVNLVHKDERQQAMQAMRNHLEGKAEAYECSYRIKCKDGNYRRFYDKGKIIKKEGETIHIAGLVLDITTFLKIGGLAQNDSITDK